MEWNQQILEDEKAALERYVDQPGQWEDVTPLDVKQEQDRALQAFVKDFNEKRQAPEQ